VIINSLLPFGVGVYNEVANFTVVCLSEYFLWLSVTVVEAEGRQGECYRLLDLTTMCRQRSVTCVASDLFKPHWTACIFTGLVGR
jgi:hypothetical protein